MPYWASTLAKNAIVGAHIFYRWAGGWGQPAAFSEGLCGPRAQCRRAAHRGAVGRPRRRRPAAEPVAEAIEKIPGAEALKLAPSMRGDKRVAVRFNLVARKASDEAPHEDYTQKFEASDNLKWALSGETVAAEPAAARQARRGAPAAAPRLRASRCSARRWRAGAARARRQRQLDPQPDPVEPAVDRQIIVRQRRRRAPLPPGHRELR